MATKSAAQRAKDKIASETRLKLSEDLENEVNIHNMLEKKERDLLQEAQNVASERVRRAVRAEMLQEQLQDYGGIHPEVLERLPQADEEPPTEQSEG